MVFFITFTLFIRAYQSSFFASALLGNTNILSFIVSATLYFNHVHQYIKNIIIIINIYLNSYILSLLCLFGTFYYFQQKTYENPLKTTNKSQELFNHTKLKQAIPKIKVAYLHSEHKLSIRHIISAQDRFGMILVD